jgi:hypothetical protein
MKDKYFGLFEAVTWIAFGRAFDEELYIGDLPEYEKLTRRFVSETEMSNEIGLSTKEYFCRVNGVTPEEYDARFIDFDLPTDEAKASIVEAQEKLIDSLADEDLNIRAWRREDEYSVGPLL